MRDKAKDHVRTKSCQIIQDTIGDPSAIATSNLLSKNAVVQAVQQAKKSIWRDGAIKYGFYNGPNFAE
jgi:hydroxymethylpyrimidine/phosphomethylpyrimidine kinase